MLAKTLGPEGGKLSGGPTSIGEGNESDSSLGVDMRRCANKDAGLGWDELGGVHIDWRSKRVRVRMLVRRGNKIVRSHILEGKPERKNSKIIISFSGEIGQLQTNSRRQIFRKVTYI